MKKPLLLLLLLLACGNSFASPNFFTYSSYLTDSNRKPRALAGQMVYFRLFADSTGGTKIWEEPHGVVAPNGFISVQLGTNPVYPLPVRQIQSAPALWLEMQIYGESAFPRQKIATSFFAIAANYADSARHAVLADSAKCATHAAHTTLADRAIVSDTAEYARGGSAVVSAQKADSASKAGTSILSDSAARAGASRSAANADSLGGLVAGRYVRTDTDGKVGIGTIQPSANLEISGDNDPVLQVNASQSSSSVPMLAFRSSRPSKENSIARILGRNTLDITVSEIRFIRGSANDSGAIGFETSGREAMRIGENGNIGIGTKNPSLTLDVREQLGVFTSADSTRKLMLNYKNGVGRLDLTNSADDLGVSVVGTDRIYVKGTTGYVGIGTNGPRGTLDVKAHSNGWEGGLTLTAADNGSIWRIHPENLDGGLMISEDEINTRLVIRSNGNVGIGVNSPKAKLHVTGLYEYADNAAAIADGLTAGAFYRTGDILKVVH